MAIEESGRLVAIADRVRKRKRTVGRAFEQLADIIFPPRCLACPEPTETPMGLCQSCWRDVHFLSGHVCDYCGVSIASGEGGADRLVCQDCTDRPPAWDRGRAAMLYSGAGRRIVMALKHGDRLDMTRTLSRWMTGAGADITREDMLVVPVPLHWRRFVARRYNQAAELARHVAWRMEAEMIPDLLCRRRHSAPQKGLTLEERFANQSEIIDVSERRSAKVCGRDVLLIDDVMTSGATLGAASEALRQAGAARIHVLVLARVAKPD